MTTADARRPASIRIATEQDAAEMVQIYSPAVTGAVASFETEVPTPEEMARRLRATLPSLPWLVCADGNRVAGYAYAAPHRPRAAYRWSIEVSVYVRQAARRRGVARGLYVSLLALLANQGYQNAYAGITLPNRSSVALHEAVGFRPVGIYNGVGYKQGAWHDVGWWQKELGTRPAEPSTPVTFDDLRGSPACAAALATGSACLRPHAD